MITVEEMEKMLKDIKEKIFGDLDLEETPYGDGKRKEVKGTPEGGQGGEGSSAY